MWMPLAHISLHGCVPRSLNTLHLVRHEWTGYFNKKSMTGGSLEMKLLSPRIGAAGLVHPF
jgi:hypothetical protein